MTTRAFAFANLIGGDNKISLEALPTEATEKSTASFESASLLPPVDNEVGSFAFIEETNRLYIWNGNGWYNIALINTNPTITGGVDSSYVLEYETPLVISMIASDPEEIALSYSYELISGSPDLATITNVSNIFTVTPTSNYGIQGSFSVVFKASDGINIATKNVTFSLTNQAPSNIAGLASTYTINNSESLTLNLSSTDPEGQPLTWSYQVISGSLNGSTVSNNNNVFTIASHPTNTSSATIRFLASDGVNSVYKDVQFELGIAVTGGVLYKTPGTYTWTVPDNVTSVNVLAISGGGGGASVGKRFAGTGGGGGALGWGNGMAVIPGETYTITVGAGGSGVFGGDQTHSQGLAGGHSSILKPGGSYYVFAAGGRGGITTLNNNTYTSFGQAPTFLAGAFESTGGTRGGRGYVSERSSDTAHSSAGGAGGAGVYSGTPADGGVFASANSGGGGGGNPTGIITNTFAGGNRQFARGGNGGGVGVYGLGHTAATRSGYDAAAGSGGVGTNPNSVQITTGYGGGGHCYGYVSGLAAGGVTSGPGGSGAVRIIWGSNRAFPSTNVSLASSANAETTI